MDTHSLALRYGPVMLIEHLSLRNGQRNCPGNVIPNHGFCLADLSGAFIQTVIAKIHAKGQQGIFIDLGDSILYQCVIAAAFFGQKTLGTGIEFLPKAAVRKIQSHVNQVSGGAFRVGFDVPDGFFYNGLDHDAVHAFSHSFSLLLCIWL